MARRDAVKALLFDLGGVLIEIDWERMYAHWARCGGVEPAALRERFGFDTHYERHERGEIAAAAYFAALRERLALDLTDADFAAGWNAIFVREVEPTLRIVRELAGRIPMYVFSNTNAAHHEAWSTRFAQALEPFERVFVSSQIGLRKPSGESFAHVAREIGLPPDSILFFDDMAENVAGARAAGMPAVHVRGPRDVRAAVSPWLDR